MKKVDYAKANNIVQLFPCAPLQRIRIGTINLGIPIFNLPADSYFFGNGRAGGCLDERIGCTAIQPCESYLQRRDVVVVF